MPESAIEAQNSGRTQSSFGRSRFFQGVLYNGLGTSASVGFLFLETAIAVRILDPAIYGVYVLLTVVIGFLDTIIDFGCTTAVTQLIASSDKNRQTKLANSAIVFRLCAIVVISVLIWLGKDVLVWMDSSGAILHYLPYIPIMLAVYSLDELLLRILQGFHSYHHMAISQIVRSIMRPVLAILFLVVFQLGIIALVYSWIISFGISALYVYAVLPMRRRFALQRPLVKELLRFGFPIQLNQFLILVSGRADILLLGTLAAPASVAIFVVGSRIPQALLRLSEAYTAVYFPTISTLLAEGKTSKAHAMLNNSLRLLSFASALIALTAVVFSHQVITFLFSEKYAASSLVFALLMISFHMDVLVNLMGYTLTAAGYPGRSLGESGIRVASNLLANVLLIPLFTYVGAAVARILSYYISNPVDVWLLRRSNIHVAVGPYAKQTVLLLFCIVLFWWLQPVGFIYQSSIVILFVFLNIIFSTVSLDDLIWLLPQMATKRFSILQRPQRQVL